MSKILKYQSILVMVFATISFSFANDLVVLETFYPDSRYSFGDQYSDFGFSKSETGDLIALYALTGEDGSPSWRVKQYPENEPAYVYGVGAFYGMGGWFHPTISGFEDQNLLVQETSVGDIIGEFATYKLRSIDLTPNNNHSEKYFYTNFDTRVNRIWKTDSNHIATFCRSGDWDLNFITGIDLFSESISPYDSNIVMRGDTLVEIGNVLNYTTAKLKSDDSYLAIYHSFSSDSLDFVYVNNDSVIAQGSSVLPEERGRYHIRSTEESFLVFRVPGTLEAAITLWEFNANTYETTTNVVYTSPVMSNEYLYGFTSALLADEIVLQVPVLKDQSSSDPTNWHGLINKRISLSDYSVTAIDTIIIFESQTDIIHHRLISDGENTHSLIAARTPEYSRLYYYGPNNLVNVDEKEFQAPNRLVLNNVYPNPFNNQLTIDFILPNDSRDASLDIFDLKGRLIWSNKSLQGGSTVWNGQDIHGVELESGVYFVRLSDEISQVSKKIMLLK